jgi:urease accessory protein
VFSAPVTAPTHFLLLLSDSALPLGSFAFSSGLESYLAHNRRRGGSGSPTFSFFLASSLSSYASTALPFVLAAHRSPDRLAALDDELDAAIICTVGRRASIAQGKALLGIWDRSFRGSAVTSSGGGGGYHRASAVSAEAEAEAETETMTTNDAQAVLRSFADLLRQESNKDIPLVSAHLAPLFGVVCAAVGLTLQQTAYVFMLGHAKALVSAAVRASMFGPYQAQKVLSGPSLQAWINTAVEREWNTPVEEAGQSVPVMDLWIGRHEMLYSRIFNS